MKIVKPFLITLAVSLFAVQILSATGQTEATEENNIKPVKILSEITGGKDPDEHDLWIAEVERLSGIPIEMIVVSGSDYNTKMTTTLAAGEDYDIFYLLAGDFEKLNHMDLFEPMTEMIENSPIFSDPNVIDQEEWERIRREDGEIYSVFNKYEGGRLPLVRWDWLQKLGLNEPVTLDDYHEMFRQFTYNDPDGDGKDNTYGLTLKNLYDIQPFMSAFGIGGGYAGGYAVDVDGKSYLPWASDEAAAVYDWLALLFEEGLIDPNFPTNGSSNCREMILSSRAGMMVYWDSWTGLFNEKAQAADSDTEFEIRGLVPPVDANGNTMLTAGQDGIWVMLKRSNNKEEAFRFLEFLNTYDGQILQTLGIKDYDYTKEGDNYILTEIGKQHAMDHGVVVPKALNWINPVKIPMNFEQSLQIVSSYGQPEILKDTSGSAKEIIVKYGVRAIMGAYTGEEAVAAMQKELKNKNYID
jgi:putative aldouronate transport system substrate-binding protein